MSITVRGGEGRGGAAKATWLEGGRWPAKGGSTLTKGCTKVCT